MGLGLHGGGVGVAKFFSKQGAEVLVTDIKPEKQLQSSLKKLKGLPITYVLGRHRQEDFIAPDLVVKNPAVPRNSPFLKIARRHHVPVKNDIEIFFELCDAQIIGITGTKGKSTTATLIHKLLRKKYPDILLAGNIGVSPLEILGKITKKSKVVLELSSFEIEDLKQSPEIALITNLLPDHLDRYRDFKEYTKSKKPIFEYQRKKDILLLNYDNLYARKFASKARSKVYFFSLKEPERRQIGNFACFLRNDSIFFNGAQGEITDIKNLKIYGSHNISNVLGAVSVAKILQVADRDIKKVLSDFRGVANRQEFIRELNGVKYFNDTTSTMPESTIAALITFEKRFPGKNIILIAGGENKGLSYQKMADQIKKTVHHLIIFPGTASDKLEEKLKGFGISYVNSMASAVKKAEGISKKGNIVILSPAAASFNLFENEFDRGRQFVKEVINLK